MKKLVLIAVMALSAPASGQAPGTDAARWEQQARNVTIIRDDWGIAHVYGKTDADAVFGMIYAQAEDDFNRVETNYLTSLGRTAEAEGESKIWQDLRMRLFIDPDSLKAEYASSPAWLKALMNAWADGLNFYLAKHPAGEAASHHALRAVDGAELHRGQHRRRHREGESQPAAGLLRRRRGRAGVVGRRKKTSRCKEPSRLQRHGRRASQHHRPPCAAADQSAHLLLLPLRAADGERRGAQRLRRGDLGQFFVYQGFNDHAGWMHTSSGVDATDEFLETVVNKPDGHYYKVGNEERPVRSWPVIDPVQDRPRHGRAEVHGLPHASTGRLSARRTASG